MKKVMYLLTTLLIGGMMLTGCKKNDPDPEPEPTPTTAQVAYIVTNTNGHLVLSPCFKMNVTYIDANGQEVTENGVELPWIKILEVTPPFHAKMVGQMVYNEDELPETVTYGRMRGLGYYDNGSLDVPFDGNLSQGSKESYINLFAQHPDRLQFTAERDF